MSFNPTPRQLSAIKFTLFSACLLPLGRLLWAAYSGDFGANPVEFVQRWTGTWSINLLWLTLCVTPLRTISGWHWLLRLRRMLGLFVFFYATLHFLAWVGFDHEFAVNELARDIFKRPFITVGFAAFLLLIPLAATSSQRAIKSLGGRRWQSLHRSIYPLSMLVCVHYFWLVKATALIWPLMYTAGLIALLGWRVNHWRKKGPAPLPTKDSTVRPLHFFRQKPD